MLAFPDYQVEEKLLDNARTLLWRAVRVRDGLPVLIKCLPDSDPGWEAVAHLRREYTIMAELELPGIPVVVELGKAAGAYYLIMADPGGLVLETWLHNAPHQDDPCGMRDSPDLFLQIACSMASRLDSIHRQHIIHRDYNPSSLLLTPERNEISVFDFRTASRQDREHAAGGAPPYLEGSLAYISPEQTGRMNRDIDYRSDLYTLGASLYQLSCGRLPFDTSDPAELIHCHMALQPLAPADLNPAMPGIISELVLKLMAKDVKERYQTARGVLADLRQCQRLCQTPDGLKHFTLGRQDVSGMVQMSCRLCGRQPPLQKMTEALERVRSGAIEMILVSGPEGIGKTALVNEFTRRMADQGCFLMPGAFEDGGDSRPYQAFVQGFRALIRQVQAHSETSMRRWQRQITEAIGDDSNLAVELVPELKPMLSINGPARSLEPEEKQPRLHSMVQRCLGVMARPEHPLVIFLDNLQWADPLALQLLESLQAVPDHPSLLIIAAFHSSARKTLRPFIEHMKDHGQTPVQISEISLKELNQDECQHWTAQILEVEPHRVQDLAGEIMKKTGGNPLFMRRMLESLLDQNFLFLDVETSRWKWDREAVRLMPMAETVVDQMLARFNQLPVRTGRIVELAACIGPRFDLESLAFLARRPVKETAVGLVRTTREGLIYADRESSPVIVPDPPAAPHYYHFVHQSLQEMVYQQIPAARRQEVHYRLGRYLASLEPEDPRHNLYTIVKHMNLGSILIKDEAERYELASLGLEAGRQASRDGLYEAGMGYFQLAIALGGPKAWRESYSEAVAMHAEGARAAYMCGEYQASEVFIESALPQVKSLPERISLIELKMDILIAQNRLCPALETALADLQKLGLDIPCTPSWHDVGDLLNQTRALQDGRRAEDLAMLPAMDDPEKLAVMTILAKMAMPARLCNAELMAVVNLKQLRLALEYGNTAITPQAYAYYGMILCSLADNFEEGCRMGEMALEMAAGKGDEALEARVHQLILRYIRPWKEPLRQVAPEFLEAYHQALACGERLEAASAMANYGIHLASSGCELGQMADTMASGAVIIRQLNQELFLYHNEIFRQMILNLRGESPEPGLLKGSAYDEDVMLPLHIAAQNRSAMAHLYFCKMYLNYLFEQKEAAAACAGICAEYLDCMMGTVLVPLYHFYNALIQLDRYMEIDLAARAEVLSRVTISQQQMKRWAEQCPANHLHRYWLVEAEYFRVLGRNADAMDAYDQAIKQARINEYCQEEALALERAARFYSGKGNARIAALYMQDARLAYLYWGARAKVEILDREYESLPKGSRVGVEAASSGRPGVSASGTSLTDNWDIASTLKASQAISQEIVLERLLDRMMTVLLENAGAERGFLVLKQDDQLVVEAEMQSGDQAVRLLQSVPLHRVQEQFAGAVINLVVRTGESLLLNGEDRLAEFSTDQYLRTHRPKSVLCLPIMSRGQVIGALYLENRLTSQAFAPERVEVLGMLASQAAIALENAWLYAHLEQRVQTRTRALAAANLNLQKEISQRLKAEEYVRHLAYHDSLTGLPNRKLFQERLGQELARAGRQNTVVAVLFLDLDHFKDVNDSYGHEIGDMVLCEVAQRLKRAVREFDLVSRLGGDEFTLFITGLQNEADVETVLARIREAFLASLQVGGLALNVSSSIGISLFPRDGSHPEELIWKADQAMYAAKKEKVGTAD